jgi:putative tricarboxylic transport membrane protein
MIKNNARVWAGIVILLFAVTIFIQSFSYNYNSKMGPGPGLLPVWLSGSLIILSMIYLVKAMKSTKSNESVLPKGKSLRNVLTILFALIVFMLVVSLAGFMIAGTLFLYILLIRVYKWYINLGISIGVTGVLFLLFYKLLSVPLPVNVYGW